MSDPPKHPLRIPHWHIPYLEKHRIFELFHEIARELIIQKPEDHVMFTKQILLNAARSRDKARVILISSPRVNTLEIANEMAKITKQIVISEASLLSCLGKKDRSDCPIELIVRCLLYLVRRESCYYNGWIIVDCIHSEKEAKALLQLSVLPTHVIHLIPPFYPKLSDLLYCHIPLEWPEYRRTIRGIREAFHAVLKEVHLKQRNLKEIVEECVELSKIRKGLEFIKPRVLIIGPRGSGRKTQAKLLVSNLDLVHVDFEYLICQAWMGETELGEKLRACRNEACFHSELLAQVINKRILEDDCLSKGWVLTGYPYTEIDFKYLDSLDTPPNRVIFLECDLTICKERIQNRRINAYTGSATNLKENQDVKGKLLRLHPKDDIDVINAEFNFYCENYGNLRRYCGETATAINGDQSERWVYESITAIITRATPPFPPRTALADMERDSDTSSDNVCPCLPVPTKVLECYRVKL